MFLRFNAERRISVYLFRLQVKNNDRLICAEKHLPVAYEHIKDERAYILLSDRVGENPKSVLLEISENGDMLKTEFDCDFPLVIYKSLVH